MTQQLSLSHSCVRLGQISLAQPQLLEGTEFGIKVQVHNVSLAQPQLLEGTCGLSCLCL